MRMQVQTLCVRVVPAKHGMLEAPSCMISLQGRSTLWRHVSDTGQWLTWAGQANAISALLGDDLDPKESPYAGSIKRCLPDIANMLWL